MNINSAPVVRVGWEVRNQTSPTVIKIDYFIESAPYGFLFTNRKTLETNEIGRAHV